MCSLGRPPPRSNIRSRRENLCVNRADVSLRRRAHRVLRFCRRRQTEAGKVLVATLIDAHIVDPHIGRVAVAFEVNLPAADSANRVVHQEKEGAACADRPRRVAQHFDVVEVIGGFRLGDPHAVRVERGGPVAVAAELQDFRPRVIPFQPFAIRTRLAPEVGHDGIAGVVGIPFAHAAVALDDVQLVARHAVVHARQQPERGPGARRGLRHEAALEIAGRLRPHAATVEAGGGDQSAAAFATVAGFRRMNAQKRADAAEGVVRSRVVVRVGETPAAEVAEARLVGGVARPCPVGRDGECAIEVVRENQTQAGRTRRGAGGKALVPRFAAQVEELQFADVLLSGRILRTDADGRGTVRKEVAWEHERTFALSVQGTRRKQLGIVSPRARRLSREVARCTRPSMLFLN